MQAGQVDITYTHWGKTENISLYRYSWVETDSISAFFPSGISFAPGNVSISGIEWLIEWLTYNVL
jgi:hypothetical protein